MTARLRLASPHGSFLSAQAVSIGHVVALGYLRISTSPRVFTQPLTMDQATSTVDSWLSQPNVELIAPAEAHWNNLKSVLLASNAGSNLTI